MASRTDFLKLILPGRGEYVDTWDEPFNEDMQKIENFSASVNQELSEARKNFTTLGEFLSTAHYNDGTLKPTAEVARARNSYIYGNKNADGEANTLSQHHEYMDKEIWRAREGIDTLRSAFARRQLPFSNMILSGSKDGDGYPTWLSFADKVATIRGDLEPLYLMVDGKICRIRTSSDIDMASASDDTWYYLYAEFQETGVIRVDGNTESSPPDDPSGITSHNLDSEAKLFSDVAHPDWTIEDVMEGDVLTLTDSQDKGEYIIKDAGTSDPTKLEIIGLFPVGGVSSINYEIRDPLAVTLGYAAVKTEVEGRIYIGEAYLTSGAISEVRPYHFRDIFVGEWRKVDVSGSPGTFTEIYEHNLGTDIVDVIVQASPMISTPDGSEPIEQLCFTAIRGFNDSGFGVSVANALTVAVTNTLEFTQGEFTPNDSNATHAPDSLGGDVTASLGGTITAAPSGEIQPSRSVLMKWDRKKLWVKNLVPQLFYRDYEGAEIRTGHIRVIISKRG